MKWRLLSPSDKDYHDFLGMSHKTMNDTIDAELSEYWSELASVIQRYVSPNGTHPMIQFCIGRPWGSRIVAEPSTTAHLQFDNSGVVGSGWRSDFVLGDRFR